MNKTIKETITCPYCGSKQEIKLHSVVNGQTNIALKKKLLEGTFFEHTCPNCGEVHEIHYQVVYGNVDQGVTIYYTKNPFELSHATELLQKIINNSVECKMARVVTSYMSLMEKIRIADCGLDDRIVEIVKIALLTSLNKDHNLGHVDEIYCWIQDDGNLLFEIFGDNTSSVVINKQFYSEISNKCTRLLDAQYHDPINVDLDFAIEFIDRNKFNCE
jgi:transcription elongation factor Elf1